MYMKTSGDEAAVALGSDAERFTRRMFTRILTNVAATLHEDDLSVAQLAALYLLDERGALRVGDVASALGRSAPAASRMVDGLVRQGLVARREDPADRRARVLSLTKKGRAFVDRSSEARMATIAEVAGPTGALRMLVRSSRRATSP